jgi:hypothetical protein
LELTQSFAEKRLAVCKSCDEYGKSLPKVCGVCGCLMPLKVKLKRFQCPDNPPKWGKEE